MYDITWGDTVQFKPTATGNRRSGEYASVCGIVTAETEQHARRVGCPVGTTVYLIGTA